MARTIAGRPAQAEAAQAAVPAAAQAPVARGVPGCSAGREKLFEPKSEQRNALANQERIVLRIKSLLPNNDSSLKDIREEVTLYEWGFP